MRASVLAVHRGKALQVRLVHGRQHDALPVVPDARRGGSVGPTGVYQGTPLVHRKHHPHPLFLLRTLGDVEQHRCADREELPKNVEISRSEMKINSHFLR